jgi:hypothetical protein
MHNPYTPPSAQVGDMEIRKGSRIKAILAGLAVDIGGSILAGIAFIAAVGIFMASGGADGDQIASSMDTLTDDPWIYSGGLAVGFLFSALGGYTCARIARHSEYRLGAILAVLSIALGFLLGTGEESPLQNAALATTAFAATMAGVRFGVSRNGKDRIRRQQLAQLERSA